jgi:hypothetical protein
MKVFKVSIAITFLLSATMYSQNVGINSTGAAPRNCAMLDILSSNTGLLIPTLALTNVVTYAPCTGTAVDGLLVYSSAAPTGGGGTGYYYWSTASNTWVALSGNTSKDWALLGNSGTSVATNFLGTTDNVDLEFRVNNIRSGLIDIANYQTFYGYAAGQNTTAAGILNSFYGYEAGNGNTSGISNTGIGYNAIIANTTGNYNTAMGVQTLATATGSNNTALGVNSGYSISSGNNNTALGYYAMNNAGASVLSGSYNTAIGNSAGSTLTTGSYNSALGYLANSSAGTYSNSTAIGSYAQAGGNDIMILGSISGTNGASTSAHVGIGTTTPTDALVVKVPAASAINAITADVTAGNGVGNAINALNTGAISYSTIFATNSPTADGTGVPINNSNHAINGQINTTHVYSYGVYGTFASGGANVLHAGGVVGYYNANGNWGGLGYYSGFACYGGYFSGSAANINGGAGRMVNSTTSIATSVGMGSYGDLFGGWVRGNIYGLALRGERFSLYVDGKTVVNQPVVELAKTGNNGERTAYYGAVSQNPDVYERGSANLVNGQVTIKLTDGFLIQANEEDITIIVTPMGATQGVYTEMNDKNTFVIKENNNGKSSVKVSWMVIASRNKEALKLPSELLPNSFDDNLKNFMSDENNPSQGGHLWWDGQKLNTSIPPQQPK